MDALGNPLRLILTGGNVADISQGPALVEAIATDAVVADKGYDSDAFVGIIAATGAEAVIPPRCNRLKPRTYDKARYKARNLVERFFAEITNKAIRRGTFDSVAELVETIHEYLRVHNRDPKPFKWTASAETIIDKVKRCRETLGLEH